MNNWRTKWFLWRIALKALFADRKKYRDESEERYRQSSLERGVSPEHIQVALARKRFREIASPRMELIVDKYVQDEGVDSKDALYLHRRLDLAVEMCFEDWYKQFYMDGKD